MTVKFTYLSYLSTIHFVSIFLLTEICENGVVFTMESPSFGGGVVAPKPYIPHQNSRTTGTSLGCRLTSEMIPVARNCVVSCNPPKIPLPGKFSGTYAEIRKFLTNVRCGTPIHVCYFKRGRNRRRISVRNAALYWWQKKSFGAVWRNPQFFMRVCTMAPHLYSRFHPNPFRFGELLPKNPSATSKVNLIEVSSSL